MEPWQKFKRVFWSVGIPPTFWLIAFFLIPLALIWVLSFGEKQGIREIEITWTLDNYIRAFNPDILSIFAQSLWFAGLTTVICLAVGLPVALGIVYAPRGWKGILLLGIMLPFWTNLLIRTYALIAIFARRGVLNNSLAEVHEGLSGILIAMGMPDVALAIFGQRFVPLDLYLNSTSVVLGLVYVHLPFMVLPLYAALERLDRSYLEASLDLGGGHIRTLWFIVVPLALPGIISGIVITFIPALGSFLTPDLLGGKDGTMIAKVIQRQFQEANDVPFGAAISFILMYIAFAALALRAFYSRKAERNGAQG